MSVDNTLIEEIYEAILNYLDTDAVQNSDSEKIKDELIGFVRVHCKQNKINVSQEDVQLICDALYNDFWGYGPLEPLLHDDSISEIMVNKPNEVYIERSGELTLSDVSFRNDKHIHSVVQRIATKNHKKIDNITPLLNARLPDGSRVNAVISPIAINATCVNIRKFSEESLTIQNLLDWDTLPQNMADFLDICVSASTNILVAGGTGAGKTTLLNILSQMIDKKERVVTIEDAAELQLSVENLVRLESRDANTEGKGAVSIYDLVVNSLRMRPDRIIIGEVRGAEAFEMLKVLNTGHDGSMSTVHSNDAFSSLLRLENMISTNNPNITSKTIRSQIASAIDMVVYIKRFKDGTRKITELMDVSQDENQDITVKYFYQYNVTGKKDGKYVGDYEINREEPSFIKKIYQSDLYSEYEKCMDSV